MGLLKIFVLTVAILTGAYTVSTLTQLFQNYRIARKTGLRFKVIPISHLNHFWMLVDKKILKYVRKYFGESTFTRYNWMGWELPDRWKSHHEMGDVFMLVTPGRNWMYVGHPDIIMEIARRKDDFPRCLELTQVLDVFGPSISSVEGKQWVTHRKLVASCFSEGYNEDIWSESISQTQDMINYWKSKTCIRSTAEDLRTLSLDVIAKAGFGQSFKFQGHDDATTANPASSYKDSLNLILQNCILMILMGPKFFTNTPWLPFKLPLKYRQLGEAITAFKGFMTTMYEDEKNQAATSTAETTKNPTFLSSLAKASINAKPGEGMTEREIYGNIFVINFAGHDTSSHVSNFALYLIATNPQVQDWIAEEVRHVFGDAPPSEWDYKTGFPKLNRCLAIAYESLRLYTPVPVTKWTDKTAQTLDIGDRVLHIPANTMICFAYASLHTDPRFWGDDSLTFRPSRFIKDTESPKDGAANLDAEEFVPPRRGTFLGWSEGARNCPGKKFAQVELVATIATLFRDWRVDPVTFDGETLEDARQRVLDLIHNDTGMVLLFQMLHPERAPLVWSRR